MNENVRLMSEPLNYQAAVESVSDPAAGGIAVFAGTTRSEVSRGRTLIALEYEAYSEMAVSQLAELVAEARQRWPVTKALVWHRTGRVPVGEPSVVIAVSTPHRAEAFGACHWIIDELKRVVTIWKKEVWDDAVHSWVNTD